ncbi:MFS transporter [Arthrobacter sp. B2a2-09]|uniref:MFS transporter n=1 Tax=Arthrobacter sp. B2a2-09 TaxID=2952822 RepID=UPI0022CDAD8E|nr:MFS transporter [Arthrobacter sp. B2a2-09]MCZ9881730.1 MFS transporter [Arthrobacter sp. B2a2-09]
MADQVRQGPEPSTWAPMASVIFRGLWFAQLGSNVGTWMQTVGAQWMLVTEPNAATLVSLVQVATTLPVMLLSLPSGVLADLIDRRHLLISVQTAMALTAGLLAVLTWAGVTTPVVVLVLLFLMGCGQALTAPAWQAIQPSLVPRAQIPAAAALGSMNVNVGRAAGPAIAGVLVAVSGPTLVFALNAVSFIGVVVVLIAWREKKLAAQALPMERPVAALGTGLRFIRNAPAVRRILLRSVLFIVPASALWALLPVVAHGPLHLGSAGYGGLLGALGLGAVLGAFGLSRLRMRFSANELMAASAIVFGAATVVLALVPSVMVVALVLILAGTAWLVVLSILNSSMQLMLPNWVRARGLAAYMVVFMGGQAVGSLLWGGIAGLTNTVWVLIVSAILLAVCAMSVATWPLPLTIGRLDLTPSAHWPEPALVFEPDPSDGPVMVLKTYQVAAEDIDSFTSLMCKVGEAQQRSGGMQWGLFADGNAPGRFVEKFLVRSWEDHLRQHQERNTAADQAVQAQAEALSIERPTVRHLIAATASTRRNGQ